MTDRAYIDEHHAIVGNSGAGKTVTAKEEAEQLLTERRHLAIIDLTDVWYGLRSDRAGTGAGFDIPIFGGAHGDVPIGPYDGDAIARIVIEQRVSAIVSLAHIHDDALQRVFLAAFMRRLRAKPRGNFHLIVDEAEEVCPQMAPDDVAFGLTRDMIWIAKRGRVAGFVLHLITQRPADVSKAVLSQAQTIIAHQLVDPRDQKAIDDYLKAKGDKDVRAEVMRSLPSLGRGERWIYSPRLGILERGFTPAIATFDSSRTPAPGEVHVEPKLLAELDVSAIAAALAKPAADAPSAAAVVGADVAAQLAGKDVEIGRLRCAHRDLAQRLASAEQLLDIRTAALATIGRAVAEIHLETVSAGKERPRAPSEPVPPAGGGEAARTPAKVRPPASPNPKPNGDDQALRRGRKALLPLARIYPARLSEAQWATLAGFSKSGGTWGTYKGALRGAGYIEQDGEKWGATLTGVEASGIEIEPLPAAGPELARFWGARIPGVRRMVDVLIKRSPHFTTREGLAADLGMSADGGTFGTYLGRLRSNGLLEAQGKRVRLAPSIMGDE